MNAPQTELNNRSQHAPAVRLHQSHFVFNICLNLVPGDVTWCRIIIHIKAGRVWKGLAFFAVGGGTSLFSFVQITSGTGTFTPSVC